VPGWTIGLDKNLPTNPYHDLTPIARGVVVTF
jgi:hypothetical protein